MSQSLAEGDLPSVRTEVKSANGMISCSTYTSNDECDCFEIEGKRSVVPVYGCEARHPRD